MSRVMLASVLLSVWFVVGADALRAAEPGEIEGDIPAGGGLALVDWGGGSLAQVESAATSRGCDLRSVWRFIDGRAVGYLVDAPTFVNAPFLEEFPDAQLPASAVVLVCARAVSGIQPVGLTPAFAGREFDRPVELVPYPGGRFLVAQQGGRVLMLDGGAESTFLDLTVRESSEEGLLSVALDPAFASNSHVWAYYSVADGERRTRLSRFTVSGDVAGSELVVLEVPQPYANHNGGAIRFGPDGMLYLGLGDGGSGGNPEGNGQNTDTLLGSIIRIDVRNATVPQPYVIPSDNPFASGGGRGEIWAYGFRNPWRMAFDAATGSLWVGDVGQSSEEEVDIVTRGGNYGWNRLEGMSCYQAGCSSTGTVLPVAAYGRDDGCSITGGVVARDAMVPEVQGAYLFADHCTGTVWAISAANPGAAVEVGQVDGNPTSFATDGQGTVYLVQFGGPIMQVVRP